MGFRICFGFRDSDFGFVGHEFIYATANEICYATLVVNLANLWRYLWPVLPPILLCVLVVLVLREPLGHETLTHLRLDGAPAEDRPLVARGAREFQPAPDGATPLFLDADRLHIFWKDTGRRIDADLPGPGSGEPSE